jgi:hypothetical protein
MRHVAASQRMRNPGVSVSNDSFATIASPLKTPSPQRTPAES